MGIELELEGFSSGNQRAAQDFLGSDWAVTSDGSLRNGGVEFVTNGGKGGAALVACFERMHDLLSRVNYDASFRCSTHMHINMLDFTFNQVARFLLAYTCAEPVLFTFCGNYRKSSNFCVPVCESLPFHKRLISRLYDDAISARSGQSCNKYTAMNFLPLFSGGNDRAALGTVEFRGGRPLTTLNDFLLQANLLLSIKQYVRQFEGTDDEFLASITTHGVLTTVYGNGVASSISTPQDQLDEAMVTAWILLKSYQAGKNSRAQQRQREESLVNTMRSSPREFSFNATGLTGPTYPFPFPISTRLSQCIFGRTINPAFRYFFEEIEGERGVGFQWAPGLLPWERGQWPSLHEYLRHLQEDRTWGDLVRLLEPIMMDCPNLALRKISRNDQRNYVRATLAMLSFQYVQGHPSFVIDFLLRFSYGLWQGVPSGNLMPGVDTDASQLVSFGSYHLWTEAFNRADLWQTFRDKCPQYWDHEREHFVLNLLNYVLTKTVRTKSRGTLQCVLESYMGESSLGFLGLQQNMLCSGIRHVLNIADRRSIDHIHREDLAEYDRYCDVVDTLNDAGLSVPVIRAGGSNQTRNPQTNIPQQNLWFKSVIEHATTTMGLGRVGNTRRSRISATTGKALY